MDFELLAEHSEGIIATSGCLGEWSHSSWLGLHERGGEQGPGAGLRSRHGRRRRFQDIFGRDNFFIEIQDHGLAAQRAIMPDLLEISSRTGAPLLATNDAHYTQRAEHDAHDVLLCIQTGSLRAETSRLRFEGGSTI